MGLRIPPLALNNGVTIPQLGLGTARVEDAEIRRIVGIALGLVPQRAQIADNTGRGIVTQSWSPLANAGALLKNPVPAEIADGHGRSPVQVVLAWHLRQGWW